MEGIESIKQVDTPQAMAQAAKPSMKTVEQNLEASKEAAEERRVERADKVEISNRAKRLARAAEKAERAEKAETARKIEKADRAEKADKASAPHKSILAKKKEVTAPPKPVKAPKVKKGGPTVTEKSIAAIKERRTEVQKAALNDGPTIVEKATAEKKEKSEEAKQAAKSEDKTAMAAKPTITEDAKITEKRGNIAEDVGDHLTTTTEKSVENSALQTGKVELNDNEKQVTEDTANTEKVPLRLTKAADNGDGTGNFNAVDYMSSTSNSGINNRLDNYKEAEDGSESAVQNQAELENTEAQLSVLV